MTDQSFISRTRPSLAAAPPSKKESGHTIAICASRVIGTRVKNRSADVIGVVKDVVLDKLSNNILFAVVGFGGFLGIGEKYHPIPWQALDYVAHEEAYVVSFSRAKLQTAPTDSLEELTRNSGLRYRTRAFDYYDVPHYW